MLELKDKSEPSDKITDIIKILSFLNYDGTVRLNDVDTFESVQQDSFD